VTTPIETDVLIIGAGPVGLALAIELGLGGIRVAVLEQHTRVGNQPRAKTTNVRSMTHMRRWGIADAVRQASPLSADYPTDVLFATRLFGEPLAHIENAFYGARRRDDRFPEPAQWIPQYTVEAVLRDRAKSLPSVDLRFGTRLEAFGQDADGIAAEAVDLETDRHLSFRARYLVGADGARSRVRKQLGIPMEGRHAYSHNYGVVYRSPGLSAGHPQAPAIMYWLVNPDTPAITGPMDRDDVWYFIMPMPDGETVLEPEAAAAAIRRAVGRDIPVEILSMDPWSAHSLVATRYSEGRVYLAGDACHLHPPFGGYGMNMGIGDAVDLGWKLAARLQGWGGAGLLTSYEAERRPVHRAVVEEAVANNAVLSRELLRTGVDLPGAAGAAARAAAGAAIRAQKIREFDTLGVVLGLGYHGSPIVASDGSAPPPWHFADFRPTACPGALAPHLWLDDGSSLYDRFGRGFTLLVTGPGGADDSGRLAQAADACSLPLTILSLPDPRLAELYGTRLALIRPDQHVAWRGDRLAAEPGRILDHIRGA